MDRDHSAGRDGSKHSGSSDKHTDSHNLGLFTKKPLDEVIDRHAGHRYSPALRPQIYSSAGGKEPERIQIG